MHVLLLAEITDGVLSMDATAKAVTAAAGLGEIAVLCAGATAAAAAPLETATTHSAARSTTSHRAEMRPPSCTPAAIATRACGPGRARRTHARDSGARRVLPRGQSTASSSSSPGALREPDLRT